MRAGAVGGGRPRSNEDQGDRTWQRVDSAKEDEDKPDLDINQGRGAQGDAATSQWLLG